MTTVNGEPRQGRAGESVADVVAEVVGTDRGVAVAIDGQVVPRSLWPTTEATGAIEIVTAAQGG